MTIYDDPNREAVGLAPIWTGAGEPPEEMQPVKAAAKKSAATPTSESPPPEPEKPPA